MVSYDAIVIIFLDITKSYQTRTQVLKVMSYKILGLDLGTNSIGWAVVEHGNEEAGFLEEDDAPTKGVLIFPEGVNIDAKTGNIKSRASKRTDYRGARRLKFRQKLRKYETLKILRNQKPQWCPLSETVLEKWRHFRNPETERRETFRHYPDEKAFLNWLKTDEADNKNPYYYRDKFSREKYDWETNESIALELGRAFYHIAQRRGFKSNRLEQSDENKISETKELIQDAVDNAKNSIELHTFIKEMYKEYDLKNKTKNDLDATQQKIRTILNFVNKTLSNKKISNFEEAKSEIYRYINKSDNLGPVKGGIQELTQQLQNADCETLGQYFWHLYQQNRHDEDNKIRTLYTAREEHYLAEFDHICTVQKIGNINENYSFKNPSSRYSGLALALYKAIFYQRPLKSQKGQIGKCTFESNKPRCPVSRPEFEEYRMWSFINNIKIKTPSDSKMRPLTFEEKESIIPRFYLQRSTFKMQEIAETLFDKEKVENGGVSYYRNRHAKDLPYAINYKLNTTVSGSPVSAVLKNILGDDWKTITYSYQITDRRGKAVQKTADYTDMWHIWFTFEDTLKLKEYASKKLGLKKEEIKKFSKVSLQQGYANLSLKAINRILPWLKKGLVYSHAVFMANLDKVVDPEIWKNSEERKIIEEGFHKIIESQSDESRKAIAVNSLLKKYRNGNEANLLEKDLENKLEEIFGSKTWKEKADKKILLDDATEQLETYISINKHKKEFVKIKRIDDRIKEFLLGNNTDGVIYCSDQKRLEKYLYHPSDLENFKPKKSTDKTGNEIEILPLPKTDAIKNPVLMRAMHQLRKLINQLLFEGVIDDKTRIHIEMAREINDANRRKAWKQWQDGLRDENEEIAKVISELFREQGKKSTIESDDIKKVKIWSEQLYDEQKQPINIFELARQKKKSIEKYKLWKEQAGICLYTGKSISLTQLFDGTSFDIEHTIPRSRSWDNSMMNKTVADSQYQRQIKGNKIPFELGQEKQEEILLRIKHWKNRYEHLDAIIKNMNPSRILDPEKRSAKIVDKHVKTFERDYWKGKYERFVMEEVPTGFKNSQITDTGLITRFSRKYLSCLFRTENDSSNVRVVNGLAVSEFRKAWGLQEEYEKKSRVNHIHHCIDATTIACMTKKKYDAFAEEWRKAEEEAKYDVKENLGKYKPWRTFTQDVLNLENEVMVVHTHKNNLPKQTKKKERKRGKIQYKDKAKTKPIYQQGDTVRGSLHKETFYGAIAKDKDGNINRDKEGNIIPNYVVRKELSKLKKTDVKNIVDEKIQDIIETAVSNKIISFNASGAKVKETIWQNKDKQIPIKKVRVYTPTVKSPLKDFKKHAKPFLSDKDYKQQFNVVNDENYCIAIYEGLNKKGKPKRTYETINNLTAGEYYKLSNKDLRKDYEIVPNPHDKNGLPLKYLLNRGTLVLFYSEEPSEIWSLDDRDLCKRFYKLAKFDAQGRLTFRPHNEARAASDLKEVYSSDFKALEDQLRVTVNNFNALVEGTDFVITVTGKLTLLD